MDVCNVKNALRLQQREARDSMDPLTRQKASAVACRHAIEAWEQLRIDRNGDKLTLFSYLSFGSEISTTPLIEHCWSQGDRVLAPRVDPVTRTMELREMDQYGDIVPGIWNIPEPALTCKEWSPEMWTEIDWVVVPGLAFDRRGGRIGYGGGYYDRFTVQVEAEKRNNSHVGPLYVSLLLPGQLLTQVPMEPRDLRVDVLFTLDGRLDCDY
ncbi:5-formyltetrahydrofolate cyclo-ligase [Paenibacillus polymyxa]|uniref:5-formyltetrahydrofolate cyclo-ligase n=1 Tax=Paenibacillus polymyxa TaxID=1406 RepID=A0A1D7MLP9_PAEPO|nr:5-formyltetrahydrofolate cyclo-ligase [Paenibacillus polymyxa]AOK91703.1 5-formyltetrahydrofolate cyclo-ligase [Paenibacillus polymyxa]KYG95379.1 5-formyltetrahydrofolate cyclo-ligase [Paenibacillus polymyxa]MCF2717820.1 5-formyltetrahydrofolate cyclo-ligase [Paenibacillus sp. UKAQ_18]URJ53094.1 5-formyltetrahydrofolate cyclo-ligase [Paenibacillus polymyxa]